MSGPGAVAFEALKFGVTELQKGDITLRAPETVGVKAEGLPKELRARLKSKGPLTKTIFTYRSWVAWWDHYSSVDQDGDGPARERADQPPTAFGYEWDQEVVEQVNLKLRCILQYNGPEIWGTFDTAIDGMRSRLGAETTIDIKPQLDLETRPAPGAWPSIGLPEFPVIYLPVSIFVNEPWPSDNFKASFMLVLSGMWGFGDSGSGSFQLNYAEHSD
jgi:hypothetical protein